MPTRILNQVFISYRQESPEHARDVRRLGELLRQAKLPVVLDQFYLDEHPGGPDEGWPKWCENCATQSACVLVVASEGWFAAYEGTARPHEGHGAATEADLFRQVLWDEKGHNERLRLAFLHAVGLEMVPKRLRAWHRFRPFHNDEQLDQLVRWVAQRLGLGGIEPPTVRWPAPMPFEPDLADRVETEWQAICDLLSGRSRERILLFEGGTGLGKSLLVRQADLYAAGLGVPVARVNLKGGGMADVAAILGQLDLDLGDHLPTFRQEGASKSHSLRKDLRALRRPVLAIFDSFEDAAGNQGVVDWLNQHFLAEVETSLGLAVIVAGQKVPDRARAGWRDLARHLVLKPIDKLEHWEPWIHRNFPDLRGKGAHLPTILMVSKGNPAVVASCCQAIAGA